MSETLTVLIDDTDPGIKYSGDWVADKGSLDNFSNYGPPLMGTSHYINGTGSFTWSFSGTYVGVFGSSVDGKNPNRVCTVDGVTITNNNITQAVNGIMQCQVDGLKDGQHTLVVTVPTANPLGYWFDNLMYIPSASINRENSAMMLEFDDPSITYSPEWSTADVPFGTITRQGGASMSVQLTGPATAIWMGFYLSQFPFVATAATYTIDGGDPMSFNLDGTPAQSTGAELNQRFFSTGPLSAGPHVLNVTFNGNNSTTPLTLYSFTVLNGTAADAGIGGPIGPSHPVTSSTSTTSGSSTPTTSGSSTPTGSSKSHVNVGAIVGGILGALGLAILLLLFFIYWRKRRSMAKSDNISTQVVDPFQTSPSVLPPAMSEYTPSSQYSASQTGNHRPTLPTAQSQLYPPDLKQSLSSSTPGTGRTQHPNRASERTSDSAESEIVILHEDSGVRLPLEDRGPGTRVVEMPPTYSVA